MSMTTMMTSSKRWMFFFFAVLGIFIWKVRASNVTETKYTQLPVTFSLLSDCPLIQATIEGRSFLLLVDLGMTNGIGLDNRALSKISKKTHVVDGTGADGTGKTYSSRAFAIPSITFGKETFQKTLIGEYPLAMRRAGIIQMPRHFADKVYHELSTRFYEWLVSGSIGWYFFREPTLFDLSRSSICKAKTIEDLPADLSSFIEIPLEINKRGFMIEARTDLGVKKFLLDTGTTYSLFREDVIENPQAQAVLQQTENLFASYEGTFKNSYISKTFKIQDFDLGKREFFTFPIDKTVECDGILGMDFFLKNTICLDPKHKKAYIKPN